MDQRKRLKVVCPIPSIFTPLAAKVAKYLCAFPEGTDVWLKDTLADCVLLFGQKIQNLPKTQQNKRWVLKTAQIKQQVFLTAKSNNKVSTSLSQNIVTKTRRCQVVPRYQLA